MGPAGARAPTTAPGTAPGTATAVASVGVSSGVLLVALPPRGVGRCGAAARGFPARLRTRRGAAPRASVAMHRPVAPAARRPAAVSARGRAPQVLVERAPPVRALEVGQVSPVVPGGPTAPTTAAARACREHPGVPPPAGAPAPGACGAARRSARRGTAETAVDLLVAALQSRCPGGGRPAQLVRVPVRAAAPPVARVAVAPPVTRAAVPGAGRTYVGRTAVSGAR